MEGWIQGEVDLRYKKGRNDLVCRYRRIASIIITAPSHTHHLIHPVTSNPAPANHITRRTVNLFERPLPINYPPPHQPRINHDQSPASTMCFPTLCFGERITPEERARNNRVAARKHGTVYVFPSISYFSFIIRPASNILYTADEKYHSSKAPPSSAYGKKKKSRRGSGGGGGSGFGGGDGG